MAHAKKPGKGKARIDGSKNAWGGWFVKCDLPKEAKAHIKLLPVDFDRLAEWEEEIIKQGYKLSVSFRQEKNTYVASLTCIDEDSPNHKGTLSAFAPAYWLAKSALWWQHEEILLGIWTNEAEPDEGW